MQPVIIILFINFFVISAIFDAEVAKNYFQYRHLNYVSIYGCFSKKEQVEVARVFTENYISLSLFDISDPDFNINNTYVFITNNNRLGIALDGSCLTSSLFLEQSGRCNLFNDVHIWLVFLENDTISDVFGNVGMTISTDLKVAIPNYNETEPNIMSWNLYDVYNQASDHGGELNYNFYHVHQNASGFQPWSLHENMYWRRRNMTGVTFRCLVVLPKNFTGPLEDYLHDDTSREINTFNRFHTVLIFHMRDFYNFSLNMSWTDSWGYILPNGSFDGLVRALEHKIVDFGASPLFVKTERWPVVDYGRRSWLLRSAFIFRMPKRPANFEVFLRPLDGPVWYLTVVAIILIVILLKIILNQETSMINQSNEMPPFENSWSYLILVTFGALCQQGVAENPVLLATRTIVIYLFVFAVLLYQFYSASIVGFLLMTPSKVIRNLRDLAYSKMKLGVEDVLYNKDYINKLATDPIISILEKKALNKRNVSFYTDPEVGLKLVAAGGYAFHGEVATAYPIIEETFTEDQICNLDEVQLFQTQQMHQPLQKHSPFRDMLNHVLQKIDEYGLMKRQLKHWHARKPECIRSRPQTTSVSIEEFYPALSVLVIGIAFSLIILITELIIKYKLDKMEEERMKSKIRKNLRRYN